MLFTFSFSPFKSVCIVIKFILSYYSYLVSFLELFFLTTLTWGFKYSGRKIFIRIILCRVHEFNYQCLFHVILIFSSSSIFGEGLILPASHLYVEHISAVKLQNAYLGSTSCHNAFPPWKNIQHYFFIFLCYFSLWVKKFL